MLDKPEETYPLRLMHCPDLGLAQLDHVIDGADLYPTILIAAASRGRSSVTSVLLPIVSSRASLAPSALCVDIGSNDGTLLTGFKRHGCRALGVELTKIAQIARKENWHRNHPTILHRSVGARHAARPWPAQVITMTNVFAHMASLGRSHARLSTA